MLQTHGVLLGKAHSQLEADKLGQLLKVKVTASLNHTETALFSAMIEEP